MKRKILLAVDDSRPSRLALDYAIQMSTMIFDLHYVLLHIQPMVSLILKEEARTSVSARKTMEKISNRNARLGQALLERYRRDMAGRGIASARIEVINQVRRLGFAKDIIEVAQEGHYDALVVGRRGLSGIVKLYSGSITADILEQSQVIPVWLVDGETRAGKILAAVDGSEASLRVVDHLSFMMGGDSESRVTLVNVARNSRNTCEIDLDAQFDDELENIIVRGDKRCIDQFYRRALEKFCRAGIAEERVRFETIQGQRRIGKAILNFAEKGSYQTLVVGRRGMNKSFFMGSVSRYLINNLSNGALWVVP
jgi:nucleotide-binding universal stress UspA family protein